MYVCMYVCCIRDLNKRPPAIAKKDNIVPSTLIKIVHIQEAIQYANIRSVLRKPQVSRLIPGNNGSREDNVPMICDKQTLPSSTLLLQLLNHGKESLTRTFLSCRKLPMQNNTTS